MKNKLIIGLVLLVAGFLAGFIPQYRRAQRVSHEETAIKQQLQSCDASVAIFQLRDTAAMLYLEATRQNYGTAAGYSTQLFGRIQQVADQTSDPNFKATLEDVLKAHDTITAALAKGDPAVLKDLQEILYMLERGT
jgi:hypothetical protein